MGQEIDYACFEQGDFDRFSARLALETQLLRDLIRRKAFSRRRPVAGFEIEAWLVYDDMLPAPVNKVYLDKLADPLASPELAKFNVEFNNAPQVLEGDALSRLHRDLECTWQRATATAEALGVHVLLIGTLPTLAQSALNLDNMSELNRYRALNEQFLHLRGKPIHLDIAGREHLHLEHHNVMLESATTSFQIHMQIPFESAHVYYNASLIASAPMVAVSANSPFLFGLDLWDETRIPLFEQAVETGGFAGAAGGPVRRVGFGSGYARNGIVECFEENLQHFPIMLPMAFDDPPEAFRHLRLHNGTIWRWNRPLIGFDADGTPHLRIEHRTPAAGPSIVDAVANAAFYYGLTQNLCEEMVQSGQPIPFACARDNFYQAARLGMNAHAAWRNGEKTRLRALLRSEFVPRAALGLASLGVGGDDIQEYLGLIERRIETGQNGCCWQRAFMERPEATLGAMTGTYFRHQRNGNPVSEWPNC